MRFSLNAAAVRAVAIVLLAILGAMLTSKESRAVSWVREHVLENERIVFFDDGTFKAEFSLDIGPASSATGMWRERQDLRTERIIVLDPAAGSATFVERYSQLFVRESSDGEELLVPGADVAAFDSGEAFGMSFAFRRQAAIGMRSRTARGP